MDYQTIASMIGNLGFPIVCCGVMCWMMIKDREEHRTESENFVNAINSLTLMVQRLCDKLGGSTNE